MVLSFSHQIFWMYRIGKGWDVEGPRKFEQHSFMQSLLFLFSGIIFLLGGGDLKTDLRPQDYLRWKEKATLKWTFGPFEMHVDLRRIVHKMRGCFHCFLFCMAAHRNCCEVWVMPSGGNPGALGKRLIFFLFEKFWIFISFCFSWEEMVLGKQRSLWINHPLKEINLTGGLFIFTASDVKQGFLWLFATFQQCG